MARSNIQIHSTASFRERYMEQEKVASLLKPEFGRFFVCRVEEMLRSIKLPVPPTRSLSHSFIYLTKGEAIMTIGSETYTIYAKECLFVPAGQVYSFASEDVNKGYLCHFHQDFFIGRLWKAAVLKEFEFLHVWGHPVVQLGTSGASFVLPLFQRILPEYQAHGLDHQELLQALFMALLCEVNHHYKAVTASPRSGAVHITNQFRELLFTHFRSLHRVTDYAALLHISPNHLNKSVKSVTGKSPTK